jgi:myosin-15
VDPAVAVYQQNLQRAFLQSAMAQNIQIQQQLLAQNQALQQMLVQPALTAQQQTPVSIHPAHKLGLLVRMKDLFRHL